MTQYLIRKIETCETCKGTGWIEHPHCMICGWYVEPKEMEHLHHNYELLCGHSVDKLAEEYQCTECDGKGKIETWIPLADALKELGVSMHPYDWEAQQDAWERLVTVA